MSVPCRRRRITAGSRWDLSAKSFDGKIILSIVRNKNHRAKKYLYAQIFQQPSKIPLKNSFQTKTIENIGTGWNFGKITEDRKKMVFVPEAHSFCGTDLSPSSAGKIQRGRKRINGGIIAFCRRANGKRYPVLHGSFRRSVRWLIASEDERRSVFLRASVSVGIAV